MLTDTNLRIPGVWPRFEMKPNALSPNFLPRCQEPIINSCQVKFPKCCVQDHERWVVGNALRLWHALVSPYRINYTNIPSQCSAVIAQTFDLKTSLPTQHRLQIDAWLSDPLFMMQNTALSIYQPGTWMWQIPKQITWASANQSENVWRCWWQTFCVSMLSPSEYNGEQWCVSTQWGQTRDKLFYPRRQGLITTE